MTQSEHTESREICKKSAIAGFSISLLSVLVYWIAHMAFDRGHIQKAFFRLRNVCVPVLMISCAMFAISFSMLVFLRPLPKKYRVASVIGRILFTVVFGGAIALLMFFLYMWMNGALQ